MKKIKKYGKTFWILDEFERAYLYIGQLILGLGICIKLLLLNEIFAGLTSLFFVWMSWIHIEDVIFKLKENDKRWSK